MVNESIFDKLGKQVYARIINQIHDQLKEYPSVTIEAVGLLGSGYYGNLKKESDLDIYGIVNYHNNQMNKTLKDRFIVNHYCQDREVSTILFCSNSAKDRHLHGNDLPATIVLNDKCQLCPPSKEILDWYRSHYDPIQYLKRTVYVIYHDYLNDAVRMENLKYRTQLIYYLYRYRRITLFLDPFNFEENIKSILFSKVIDEFDRKLLKKIYFNNDINHSVDLFIKKKIR